MVVAAAVMVHKMVLLVDQVVVLAAKSQPLLIWLVVQAPKVAMVEHL
jgi:hypothetical protein